MTSAQEGHGSDTAVTAVLTARAHDRLVRDLHRRVLERVLLKSKTQSVKDSFRLYDRDRAGVLTLDQFRALMRDHDFLEADSELLISHLDDRGQQGIAFHAFLGDIQLGTKQNYPKNGVTSPKKVQPLSQLGGGQMKNVTKTKARAAPLKNAVIKPVVDPMEAIRTKLRQRVMGSKSIREVFMEYDTDNSGFLDYDEFGQFMAKYKFTPEETQLIVEYLDRDSSGTVDYDEFAAGLLFYRPPVAAPVQPIQSTPVAVKNHDIILQNTQVQPTHSSKAPKQMDVQQIKDSMRRKLDESFKRAKQIGKTRDMRVEFDNYDIDDRGSLDHQEFGALLIGVGIKLKLNELQAVLQEIDPDGSERIQFQAFAKLLNIREGDHRSNRTLGEEQRHVLAARNEDGEQLDIREVAHRTNDRLDEERRNAPNARNEVGELITSFSKYHRDGSGELGYEEFRRLMNECGVTNSEEIDALIDEIDKGGSGSISLNEFTRVYGRRIKPSLKSNRQRQEATYNHDSGVGSDDEVQPGRTLKKSAHAEAKHNTKARLAVLQEQELEFMERVLRRHKSVEAAFREFDQNNHNEMDFEQFRDFMGQFGMTDATNISMLLKRLDADNSGTVDLQEFLTIFNEQRLARHQNISKLKDHHQNDASNGWNQRTKGPKLVGDSRQNDVPYKGESQRAAHRVADSDVAIDGSETSATSKGSKDNKAARLRALEEKWIACALTGHSSIRSAFATADRDQDGEITRNEFRELMNEYGVYDEEDIMSLTRKLDLDGNGNIAYEDFATVFHEVRVTNGRERQKSISAAVPSRNSAVKQPAPVHPKNVRGVRLRDLQLKWMKRVMSCHGSIEAAFYQYDQDGNGELDHNEFRYFMKRYGIVRNDDIDLLIRRLDSDDSETISFDEFSVLFNPLRLSPGNTAEDLSAMAAAAPEEIFEADELESVLEIERELAQRMARQTRDLRLAFRKFDSNGNGLLEYKEFRAVLKSYRLPEMEIRKVIRHLDRDVSGFIDYKEFLAGFGAYKEGGGTGATVGTSQKREAKRVLPGIGSSSKPKPHYRKSPPKLQGQTKPPSLETLKKRMLEQIMATHGSVQATFREYDLDKDGCVNEAQFVTLVLDCGFSRDEAARLLDLFDQDQSGTVEYEEFLAQLVVKGGV